MWAGPGDATHARVSIKEPLFLHLLQRLLLNLDPLKIKIRVHLLKLLEPILKMIIMT